MNWSTQQTAVFDWFKAGPRTTYIYGSNNATVVARAGSGKTTTIEHGIRIAPEDKIAYIVFNKRNQIEAKRKIVDPRCKIYTGHSLGFCYVNYVGKWRGCSPEKSEALDRDRIKQADPKRPIPYLVAADAIKLMNFAKNTQPFASQESLLKIAQAKGFGSSKEIASHGFRQEYVAELAFKAMEISKKKDSKNRISFDDMIWLPVVMKWVVPWYKLLVIDEAQDTNPTTLMMVNRAVSKTGRTIVVGDDRQAIYGFRGADSKALSRLQKDLNATPLKLTTTYRCPLKVVEEARTLVPDFEAMDDAPEGSIDICTEETCISKVKPGDAILSRLNAPLARICMELIKNDTPAYIEGEDTGNDLLGIAKQARINSESIEQFVDKAKFNTEQKIQDLASSGVEQSAIDNLTDLGNTLVDIANRCENIDKVFFRIDEIFKTKESAALRGEFVVLSSVHKAKGLEWDNVFLLATTFKGAGDPSNITEEDNIKYVAITRAKKTLSWVYPLAVPTPPTE